MVKVLMTVVGSAAATCGAIFYFLEQSVRAAADTENPPPSYPWRIHHPLGLYDHAALRRGWQVYKTVCSTCHSIRFVRFMDLVNVTHTEEEVKEIAAEYEAIHFLNFKYKKEEKNRHFNLSFDIIFDVWFVKVKPYRQVDDGPDEEGNYYKRPGKLLDVVPMPFPNEEAAKAANNGAFPPDLSLMVPSHHNGSSYVFSLLTGYMDPPAGITISDTQFYNIYFPGNATVMPPVPKSSQVVRHLLYRKNLSIYA